MQNHSRRLLLAGLIASAAAPAFAQQPFFGQFTQQEATRALREALTLASGSATQQLGRPSGFWSDLNVRIPLPGILGQTQSTLARFGMSAPLDNLQQSLNSAATTTMPRAATMFVDAVRTITIGDAINIVRGGSDSATQFLRGRTETGLTRLLKPVMRDALTQSGAFTLMRTALREVGLASMTTQLRTEVTDFSTLKALDGCFQYIAREERAIRGNPARRTTDTLRRVFG
ncbi:MAG: DUF4197 domain-containing protein [Terricaulis sp.]|nr:DUF4197 domain-containing protein [Terricaulis sp.]